MQIAEEGGPVGGFRASGTVGGSGSTGAGYFSFGGRRKEMDGVQVGDWCREAGGSGNTLGRGE